MACAKGVKEENGVLVTTDLMEHTVEL